MKIGILTHHFGINYGGILQCFALSSYLQQMGHTTVIISREPNKNWKTPIRICLEKMGLLRFVEHTDRADGSKIRTFVNKHFTRTQPIRSHSKMEQVCKDYNLQAVIVGSDQVWRKEFIEKWGLEYFLDFVPNGVQKLSYAASIGVNHWDYNEEESKHIAQLLASYKAISVREDEAADLIAEALNLKVNVMPDPTLLISAEQYKSLFENRRIISEPYTFIYWLNPDESELRPIITEQKAAGKKIIRISLHQTDPLPSIEDWLSLMAHADYVVTDSFHGVVFALIFERTLHIHCNKAGGFGRIRSLLNMLGCTELTTNPNATIKYSIVREHIKELQTKAYHFLNNNLK